MRALALLGCLFCLATPEDLETILRKLEETKDAPAAQRSPWIEKLCAIKLTRARHAALRLYRSEEDVMLKARLLEHASRLPALDPKVELDRPMLRELEGGEALPVRVVAARFFCEQRGSEGIDLCLALLAEKGERALHQAIIAAFGWQKAGSRGANLFVQKFEASPPTTKLAVLQQLRGRQGSHLDRVRRDALKDSYVKLRGEAMSQLAQLGDKSVRQLARRFTKGREAATLAPILFEVLAADPRPQDLPVLGGLMKHESSRMRRIVKSTVARLSHETWARQWALEDGRTHKNAKVRGFALLFLEHYEGQEVQDALYDLASDLSPANRRRAVFALAKRKDQRIVSLLEKYLEKGRIEQRLDALQALEMIRGEERAFHVRLVALAQEAPVELRLLATDLAGRHGLRELLPQLPSLLASPDWRVRATGVQFAKRVRDKTSVPLLVHALQKESGRMAQEIRDALASLTRLYYERPADWLRWWQREGASFELPPEGQERVSKSPIARGGAATVAAFYGIPVTSERVVYCLDVSGSMAKLAGTGITRLKLAQEALVQALGKSPKSSYVNVLFFENKIHPYAKRMASLRSQKETDRLVDFVRAQKPLGGTNIYDTLERALQDKRVDTIFLLSDGDPTEGEITDPAEIAEEILRLNRARRVTIHTIAIGGDSPLLRRLARETGGEYVVRK